MENSDDSVLKEIAQKIISMEYLGIHIEDARQSGYRTNIYFSVPEYSELSMSNFSKESNDNIKNADGLIEVAKDIIISAAITSCELQLDDEKEDIISDIKNNTSNYLGYYAKIRHGEVWNTEMAKSAVQKLKNNNSYEEV